jgi:hypothetical protein
MVHVEAYATRETGGEAGIDGARHLTTMDERHGSLDVDAGEIVKQR